MKIAFINIYQGVIDRGAEVSLGYLARYLGQRHKVTFFQAGKRKEKGRYKQVQIKLPFKIDSHKSLNLLGKILERFYLSLNELKILYFSLKLLPYLLNSKHDILIPTNGFWQVLICKLVRLLKKSKIVIIGWAGMGFHDADNLRLRPDLFISLTKQMKKWLENKKLGIKIVYVPNSVDCQFYHPKKKPLIKKPLPIILTVAALTPYKRIDLVIRAVAKMKTKSFLLIVGQGEQEADLRKLARKLLGQNFKIRQFSHKLIPHVYTSCQVFTLASGFQDAFPRVMLEALASGRNLVLSDSPIKREVVGKAGFFVDPKDVDHYAQTLDRALRAKNQALARRQAEKYDIRKVGQKFEKVLLSLE